MKMISNCFLVSLLVACSVPVVSESRQADTSFSIADATEVQQIGDPGAPTYGDLALISPPVDNGDPVDATVSAMLAAAQDVLDSLPPELRESEIEGFTRIGGPLLGCIFDSTWTCYMYCSDGRTHYCSVGRTTGCGSFSGIWPRLA